MLVVSVLFILFSPPRKMLVSWDSIVQSLNSPFFPPHIASERRVQDNLHAHGQNDAIFSPKSGENPYLEVLSKFGLWRDFLNDNIEATISAFGLIKNMSIKPKSVEFHECHANPHSICFLSQ